MLFENLECPEIMTFMKKKSFKIQDHNTSSCRAFIFSFITILRVENGMNKLHTFAI